VCCSKLADYYNTSYLVITTPILLLWLLIATTLVHTNQDRQGGKGRSGGIHAYRVALVPLWLLVLGWLPAVVLALTRPFQAFCLRFQNRFCQACAHNVDRSKTTTQNTSFFGLY
jgi:hypothetical protein